MDHLDDIMISSLYEQYKKLVEKRRYNQLPNVTEVEVFFQSSDIELKGPATYDYEADA